MFKLIKGRKLVCLILGIMICGILSACGGEPFADLEWDDEIYLSDDVLILEPGEEEIVYVDNYDCLKNLKVQIDDNVAIADITPGEDYSFNVVAKTEGERVITFYASYCSSVRFRIIVARDTDKAWDKYYEEEEALEEDDDDLWDDDWYEDDEDDGEVFEYDPANYETEDWTEMFDEPEGEPVQARVYNLNVHLESDDVASFIMADYLETDAVDLPMVNSGLTINKDGTYTMTVDNDEIKNSYITYINSIFDTIILSEALGYGYADVQEMMESEGWNNVDELKADRMATITEDMESQWPTDTVGVTTYTGYVEKIGEIIYLYDQDGNELFDSCEMLEDGSISIELYADDQPNPIATDLRWIWR